MPGPTRPSRRLPLSAILVVAALLATGSVLVVPPPQPVAPAAASGSTTTGAATPTPEVRRDATGNLRTAADQVDAVFMAVEAVVRTAEGR